MSEAKKILMQYQFSPSAKLAVTEHAPRIAKKRGSDRIDPLHILHAVAAESSLSADFALRHQGSSLKRLHADTKAQLERLNLGIPKKNLAFSNSSLELLRLAYEETDDSNIIHTVHLLLGVMHLGEDEPAYLALHRQNFHVVRTRLMFDTVMR